MSNKLRMTENYQANDEATTSLMSIIDIKTEILDDSDCELQEVLETSDESEKPAISSSVISEIIKNYEKITSDEPTITDFIDKFITNQYHKIVEEDHKIPESNFLNFQNYQYCIKKEQKPAIKKEIPIKNESRKRNFKCIFCDFSAGQFLEIRSHLKEHSMKSENCDKKFNLKSNERESGKELDEDDAKPCKILKKVEAKDSERISGEIEEENGEKSLEDFSCIKCASKFDSSISRLAHYINEHGASLSFKCPKCKVKYSQAFSLRRHLKNDHIIKNSDDFSFDPQETPEKCDKLECPKCEGFFLTKEFFESHKQNVLKKYSRKETNGIPCLYCCMIYRKFLHLTKHYSQAHPELDKKLLCKICKLEFHNKFLLDNHIKETHAITFPMKIPSEKNGEDSERNIEI